MNVDLLIPHDGTPAQTLGPSSPSDGPRRLSVPSIRETVELLAVGPGRVRVPFSIDPEGFFSAPSARVAEDAPVRGAGAFARSLAAVVGGSTRGARSASAYPARAHPPRRGPKPSARAARDGPRRPPPRRSPRRLRRSEGATPRRGGGAAGRSTRS